MSCLDGTDSVTWIFHLELLDFKLHYTEQDPKRARTRGLIKEIPISLENWHPQDDDTPQGLGFSSLKTST